MYAARSGLPADFEVGGLGGGGIGGISTGLRFSSVSFSRSCIAVGYGLGAMVVRLYIYFKRVELT